MVVRFRRAASKQWRCALPFGRGAHCRAQAMAAKVAGTTDDRDGKCRLGETPPTPLEDGVATPQRY